MTESLDKSKQKLKIALERLEKAVDSTLSKLESARKNPSINSAKRITQSGKATAGGATDDALFDDNQISDAVTDMETLSLSIQDLKKSVGK